MSGNAMRCYRKTLLGLMLAVTLVFSGCDKGDLFSTAAGQYQGTALIKKSAQVQQILVASQITSRSKRELEVRNSAFDSGSTPVPTFRLNAESDSRVWLLFPDWGNTRVLLKGSTEKCFSSDARPNAFSAVLCFNGADLTIDLSWGPGGDAFTLSVSRGVSSSHPVYERPQSYSVSQLMTHAMAQNFDSPIQFEHVVQGKLKTEAAYLNLIPHISLNSVLNIAALNLLGVLKAVGDIVPFLFPTRWLQAREAKYRSEAEFDAWILTKADAANVTEGLAYSVVRDAAVLGTIADNQKYISLIRDQVRERERAGLMQAGASDDIESILNTIDRGTAILRGGLLQEKMALAQAAGFYNFAAISDVQLSDDAPIDGISPYDDATIQRLGDLAIDRSYERRQINSLVSAARLGETERYFQWLDPSGDREGGLGINLIPYVKIGASQTQELIYKRQKIEAGLIDAVARSASTANQFLEAYQLAVAGQAIQSRRVERHLNNMRSGVNFSMSDLTNALQERLKAEVEVVSTQFAYYIARANINRFLLSGPYAWLPTNRGQPSWIVSATANVR